MLMKGRKYRCLHGFSLVRRLRRACGFSRGESGSIARGDLVDVWLLRADANAGCEMIRFYFHERRNYSCASVYNVRTAGMKSTPLRRIDRRRDVALKNASLTFELYSRIGARDPEVD